jgi:hypothetical protein
MSSNITITINGTPAEVRSALAELLGTSAPIAVVADKTETVAQRKKREAAEAEAPKPAAEGGAGNDPFAAPAATGSSTAQASTPVSTAQASAPGPTATVTASPSEGEVTYDELKTLMTNVLSKKSASYAQKALLDATGFKALTGLPKEIYPKAKAALEAALA